jgi:ABC-type antimicrobial peptide transport system permease subunit
LLLTGIQRRREQGMLAAVGMPPIDLARMTLVEAGLLGLTATVVGGLTSQLTLLCITWASSSATGLGLPFQPQLEVVLFAGAAATLVTLAGAALPAYRTSRLDPAFALREQ